MTPGPDLAGTLHVVLADANVLYSRVLRDYLLYAAEAELISLNWSSKILDEVTEHLITNRPTFDAESGQRLVAAMNNAFPYAEVSLSTSDFDRLTGLTLPDEEDRHVLAAALAAEATILCTANTRDFPTSITSQLGLEVLNPDEMLSQLIDDYPQDMLRVHATSAARLPGATHTSTLTALHRAGTPGAAEKMKDLLTQTGLGCD